MSRPDDPAAKPRRKGSTGGPARGKKPSATAIPADVARAREMWSRMDVIERIMVVCHGGLLASVEMALSGPIEDGSNHALYGRNIVGSLPGLFAELAGRAAESKLTVGDVEKLARDVQKWVDRGLRYLDAAHSDCYTREETAWAAAFVPAWNRANPGRELGLPTAARFELGNPHRPSAKELIAWHGEWDALCQRLARFRPFLAGPSPEGGEWVRYDDERVKRYMGPDPKKYKGQLSKLAKKPPNLLRRVNPQLSAGRAVYEYNCRVLFELVEGGGRE